MLDLVHGPCARFDGSFFALVLLPLPSPSLPPAAATTPLQAPRSPPPTPALFGLCRLLVAFGRERPAAPQASARRLRLRARCLDPHPDLQVGRMDSQEDLYSPRRHRNSSSPDRHSSRSHLRHPRHPRHSRSRRR